MPSNKQVLYRIQREIDRAGLPLRQIGEIILGSKKSSRQNATIAANNFLAGKERSFNLERVMRLSKFFDVDFMTDADAVLVAAAPSANYGVTATIEKAAPEKVEKMFEKLAEQDPELVKGVPLDTLSTSAKRMVLLAYHRKK
jgi:ABC-type molybdenum transport system ATPase subunit/photorepair protein PhrA